MQAPPEEGHPRHPTSQGPASPGCGRGQGDSTRMNRHRPLTGAGSIALDGHGGPCSSWGSIFFPHPRVWPSCLRGPCPSPFHLSLRYASWPFLTAALAGPVLAQACFLRFCSGLQSVGCLEERGRRFRLPGFGRNASAFALQAMAEGFRPFRQRGRQAPGRLKKRLAFAALPS